MRFTPFWDFHLLHFAPFWGFLWCKDTPFWDFLQVFCWKTIKNDYFSVDFMRNLVVWRSFAWSFGIFVFGHLWRFHSVICDLQIIVCCLKPPIMSQILRKQCVNILFLLGVFYNIQRKSHFRKTLIFSTLSKQRYIMEYHFAILIIWRSLVQAQAGPHFYYSDLRFSVGRCFFIVITKNILHFSLYYGSADFPGWQHHMLGIKCCQPVKIRWPLKD